MECTGTGRQNKKRDDGVTWRMQKEGEGHQADYPDLPSGREGGSGFFDQMTDLAHVEISE